MVIHLVRRGTRALKERLASNPQIKGCRGSLRHGQITGCGHPHKSNANPSDNQSTRTVSVLPLSQDLGRRVDGPYLLLNGIILATYGIKEQHQEAKICKSQPCNFRFTL